MMSSTNREIHFTCDAKQTKSLFSIHFHISILLIFPFANAKNITVIVVKQTPHHEFNFTIGFFFSNFLRLFVLSY